MIAALLPLAAVHADSLVTGCRNGEPVEINRFSEHPEFTPEQHAQAREAAWRTRASDFGLCLAFAAYQTAAADPERARRLAATGFVRARWEAIRCAASERGGQGYRFMLGTAEAAVQLQDPTPYQPLEVWRRAVKAAAQDSATYVYAIDMAKVCGTAAVRPETEWPGLRAKLQAAIVRAADQPTVVSPTPPGVASPLPPASDAAPSPRS